MGEIGTLVSVNWQDDSDLPVPLPVYPRDGASICLDNASGNEANISLEWSISLGATHYVLQICNNNSFKGPTLRSVKVAAPATSYDLLKGDDIRLDETIYWRVFALNGIGGVSRKSDIRSVSYDCGDLRDARPKEGGNQGFPDTDQGRCSDYDVTVEIRGPDTMLCCDKVFFPINISFTCQDQIGRALAQLVDIQWSVRSNPDEEGSITIEGYDTDNGCGAIVEACGQTSQVFEIIATLVFDDLVLGDQFSCEFKKEVYVDCVVPVGDKPWAGSNAYRTIYFDTINRDFQGQVGSQVLPDAPIANPDAGNANLILAGPIYLATETDACDYLCSTCLGDPRSLIIEFADQTTLELFKTGECSWSGERDVTSDPFINEDCDTQNVLQTITAECTGDNILVTLEECCSDCQAAVDCCEYRIADTLSADIDIEASNYVFDMDQAGGQWEGEDQLLNPNVTMTLTCEPNGWVLTGRIGCSATLEEDTIIWRESNNSLDVTCNADGSITFTLSERTARFDDEACPNLDVSGTITGAAADCTLSDCIMMTYEGEDPCLPLDGVFLLNDPPTVSVPFTLYRSGTSSDCPYECNTILGDFRPREVTYEARVALSIGCGLKIENGVLKLNLDDIIVPDAGLVRIGECGIGVDCYACYPYGDVFEECGAYCADAVDDLTALVKTEYFGQSSFSGRAESGDNNSYKGPVNVNNPVTPTNGYCAMTGWRYQDVSSVSMTRNTDFEWTGSLDGGINAGGADIEVTCQNKIVAGQPTTQRDIDFQHVNYFGNQNNGVKSPLDAFPPVDCPTIVLRSIDSTCGTVGPHGHPLSEYRSIVFADNGNCARADSGECCDEDNNPCGDCNCLRMRLTLSGSGQSYTWDTLGSGLWEWEAIMFAKDPSESWKLFNCFGGPEVDAGDELVASMYCELTCNSLEIIINQTHRSGNNESSGSISVPVTMCEDLTLSGQVAVTTTIDDIQTICDIDYTIIQVT